MRVGQRTTWQRFLAPRHWSAVRVAALGAVLGVSVAFLGMAARAPASASVPTTQSVRSFDDRCTSATSTPDTATALRSALAAARPGSVIALRANTVYRGNFVLSRSGTPHLPISVCGPRSAVVDGTDVNAQYGFHLSNSSYTQLIGFTVTDALKGIVADNWHHGVIADVVVDNIGQEGIHLRTNSSYDTISGCIVSATGRSHRPGSKHFGEGLYIGSANNNWHLYTHGQPDRTRNITIVDNDISQTTAESIDVKEGTSDGTVVGNHFDGTGMVDPAGADSWVDAKGDDWLFENNVGVNSPADGFQVHVKRGWGRGNRFVNNRITLNHRGYGVNVHNDAPDVTVACSNVVVGAQAALTNLSVRCPNGRTSLPPPAGSGHDLRRWAVGASVAATLVTGVALGLRRRRRIRQQ